MTTTSTPITGREYEGRRTSPGEALSHFYHAFNSRDLAAMAQNWEASPDAVMDNPLGGISRGWDTIKGLYQRLFTGANRITVEFWDYSIVEAHDCFVAIGRERGTLTGPGGTLALKIRTSRFFRRNAAGEWRQVHHHGSIDEPQLLSQYQSAVKPA
jgi:ketosteroid isomerase-like protein